MATRTIVTSQPDVACDVCERRLLRGEKADIFLATGRRRIVCELCAPRAVHEGWLRETDRQSVSLPPLRPRRGRSFLDRLPVPFRVRQAATPAPASEQAADAQDVIDPRERPPASSGEPQPYDFLDDRLAARSRGEAPPRAGSELPGSPRSPAGEEPPPPAGEDPPAPAGEGLRVEDREPPSELDRAIEAFNASEYPRRVAGVARSLGAPEVNIRSAEHAVSVVRILVAWELCWYRYEVDLDEPETGARAAGQGSELGELTREERLVNAVADDSGALSLSPA
jgi:hypothetical protein